MILADFFFPLIYAIMSISNKLHVVCKVLVLHNKGKEHSFSFCEFFFLNMVIAYVPIMNASRKNNFL